MVGLAVAGGKMVGNVVPRSAGGWGLAAGGLLSLGMIGANISSGVGVTATPDFHSGTKEVHYNIINFQPTTQLAFAVGKVAVKADVQGLKTEYKTKLPYAPDPRITCTLNREMTGKATTIVVVPFSAVEAKQDADGTTNLKVYPKYRLSNAWGSEAELTYRDYTLNKSGKNFDDTAGFCRSLVLDASSAAGLLNIDSPRNAFQKADSMINEAMSRAALRKLDEGGCVPSNINDLAVQAVREAFVQLTGSQPNTKLGTVSLGLGTNGSPISPTYGPFTGKQITPLTPASAFSGTEGVGAVTQWSTKNPNKLFSWDQATCEQSPGLTKATDASQSLLTSGAKK